jgi:CO/xanthine dehydrogenase Mo-binding subunit
MAMTRRQFGLAAGALARQTGGRGRGLGFAKYKNLSADLAVVVDVTVERGSGAIRVNKAVATIDAARRSITNAVAHATGARLRDLPLTPERLKAAFG